MSLNIEIRKKLLKKRWSINPKEKEELDKNLNNQLIKILSKYVKTKYIGLYSPIENEVDTTRVIQWLLKNHYMVCLPKIIDSKLKFVRIFSTDFEYEHWKSMKQPKENKIINGNDIQVLIVPLIGFDKNNYRLGYGLNFYNIFLHKYQNIQTIGVGYSLQKTDEIIVDKNDIKLDNILTEK